jgi:hypothetical protein
MSRLKQQAKLKQKKLGWDYILREITLHCWENPFTSYYCLEKLDVNAFL